jgi:hypothetical protein
MKRDGGHFVAVSLLMTLSCFRQNMEQTSSYLFIDNIKEDLSPLLTEDKEALIDYQKADNYLEVKVAIDNWKSQLYDIYGPTFQKMKNSTLISKQKYNGVVQVLLDLETKSKKQQKTKKERDYQWRYILIGNVIS